MVLDGLWSIEAIFSHYMIIINANDYMINILVLITVWHWHLPMLVFSFLVILLH